MVKTYTVGASLNPLHSRQMVVTNGIRSYTGRWYWNHIMAKTIHPNELVIVLALPTSNANEEFGQSIVFCKEPMLVRFINLTSG